MIELAKWYKIGINKNLYWRDFPISKIGNLYLCLELGYRNGEPKKGFVKLSHDQLMIGSKIIDPIKKEQIIIDIFTLELD